MTDLEKKGWFKRKFASMSMRAKLLTVTLSVTIMAMLVAGIVVMTSGWKLGKDRLVLEVQSVAGMLAENSVAAVTFEDQQDAGELLSSLRKVTHIEASAVYLKNGKMLAEFHSDNDVSNLTALPSSAPLSIGKRGVEVVADVMLDGEIVGKVYIRSNLNPVHDFAWMQLVTMGIAIFLAMIVSFGLASYFQSFVSTPITKLAATARKIREEKDFSIRMTRETFDEVGFLADTMNDTLDAFALSQKSYLEIFNGVHDAIFVQSAKDGLVLDVNDAVLKMYGGTRDDLVGISVEKISLGEYPYDSKGAAEKFAELEKGSQIFEWHARRLNGELFWVEVNLRKAHISGAPRILAVVRDISERRRTQEALIQSEKMMSTGGLAAGIAHEINNPLAGILQSAEVLKQRLENLELPANKRTAESLGLDLSQMATYFEERGIHRLLGSIQAAGLNASKIISNMLGFARRSQSARQHESMQQLLDRMVELAATDYNLKKQYDFRKIEVVREYAESLPSVYCDASKIQQVIFNLLRNGAEAMHDAGLKTNAHQPRFTLRLRYEETLDMVRMEIEDNGAGIPSEKISRIFEPFYTTKPVGQGTGLGLSVSYFIITEDHNGTMTVRSKRGEGACFIVMLPVKHPKRPD